MKMVEHDELNIVSRLNSAGSPFIILAIIGHSYYILLLDSKTVPYLEPIDKINNWNMAYCVESSDRTIIIHQLDGIRRGYLNYVPYSLQSSRPVHTLTCDREGGCLFTITESSMIESTIVEDVRLSGMTYSLLSSNPLTSIATQFGEVLISEVEWLIIPINARSKTQYKSSPQLIELPVSSPIESTIPIYRQYKRWISRWIFLFIAIVIIASIYVVINKNQFKMLASRTVR